MKTFAVIIIFFVLLFWLIRTAINEWKTLKPKDMTAPQGSM